MVFGNARNYIPQLDEVPSQLSKGEDEAWDEYVAALLVTLGEIASAVGLALALLSLFQVQGARDLLLNTTVAFPLGVIGQLNVFLYLMVTGVMVAVPLALQVQLVSDEKLHLVDDANTVILFSTVALVLVLLQTQSGLEPFVVAAMYTAALTWGVLYIVRIAASRR